MHHKFFKFLARSPTSWHAAKEIGSCLAEADFSPLSERDRWTLEAGQAYFVQREGSLVCAFRLPQKKPTSAILLASHTDSPALKIKPHPDLATQGISQLLTEIYGGPLLHSWLDRDLTIAGRIETDMGSRLVFLDDFCLNIPQLAIHLDRTINEKGILVHKQDHLKAVYAIQGTHTLESVLKKHFSFKTLYTHDLFLVPTEKPGLTGLNGELIAGYRLDNLSSAFACLGALVLAAPRSDALQMAIFWDHEEIGSTTSTGAGSLFALQMLERIGIAVNLMPEDVHRLKSSSIALSADVTHGWNPNFPEKYDSQNSPLLGRGVAIKFNAGRKYASDAASAASLCKIGEAKKIQLQHAANRSDIPGGSTVGPIMSANTGIPTVDIGVPCWAMHSTREIIAASDLKDLGDLMKSILEEWTPPEENNL
jgi:aspartyl aminopeptidase